MEFKKMKKDLPVPTVLTITAVIEYLSSIAVHTISLYFALSLDKTSPQYQGYTVWYKRCSALVSGRTHYGPKRKTIAPQSKVKTCCAFYT